VPSTRAQVRPESGQPIESYAVDTTGGAIALLPGRASSSCAFRGACGLTSSGLTER